MQNLSSIRQLGAELWTDSHTKVSFAIPLLNAFYAKWQTFDAAAYLLSLARKEKRNINNLCKPFSGV